MKPSWDLLKTERYSGKEQSMSESMGVDSSKGNHGILEEISSIDCKHGD